MSMAYREDILPIERAGAESLMGVLALPAAGDAAPGGQALVIVVGGPQYRVGSHRQFALLARRLAAAGIPVLRFDYAGMGDSSGPLPDFMAAGEDVGAAIDALHQQLPDLQGVTLWGLCDGASAALLYVDRTHDARVRGLCLLNPWVRSAQTFARAQVKHYYLQRLRQPEFWKKLLSGGVALSALGESVGKLKASLGGGSAGGKPVDEQLPYQGRMARAWRRFPGRVLLLLSGDDLVAKEFLDNASSHADWSGLLDRPGQQRHDMPDADHTCSNAAARGLVEELTLRWMREEVAHAH